MDLNRDGQIDATDMAIFQSMLAHWQSPLSPGRLSDPAAADWHAAQKLNHRL